MFARGRLKTCAGTFLADGTGDVNQILIVAAPAAPNQTCPAGYQLRPWHVEIAATQDVLGGVRLKGDGRVDWSELATSEPPSARNLFVFEPFVLTGSVPD